MHLTAREIRLLRLVHDGLRNRQIADSMGWTEDGTKQTVKRLLRRMGMNRVQAAVWWERERARRVSAVMVRPHKTG